MADSCMGNTGDVEPFGSDPGGYIELDVEWATKPRSRQWSELWGRILAALNDEKQLNTRSE